MPSASGPTRPLFAAGADLLRIRRSPGASRQEAPPLLLQALGWNDRWSALFAPSLDAGMVPGRVVRVDRDRVLVATESGEVAARARELPAVGDWVGLVDDAVAC